jgi:hypothetical protein
MRMVSDCAGSVGLLTAQSVKGGCDHLPSSLKNTREPLRDRIFQVTSMQVSPFRNCALETG